MTRCVGIACRLARQASPHSPPCPSTTYRDLYSPREVHLLQTRPVTWYCQADYMGPHIFLVVIGSFKSVCYGCHSHNCSHPACVISCLQPWLNACFDSWQIFLDSTSCSRHGHTAFWPVYTIQYALFWPHVSIRAPPRDAVH